MKITKRQLRRIIREETTGVEDVTKTSDAFGDGEVIEEPFIDVDEDDLLNVNGDPGRVRDILVIPESKTLKITKRMLKRIIKEEKAKILREQSEMPQVDSREHQWPSADGPIADAALELSTAWGDMEVKAWSVGDPSMNQQGELSDSESNTWWVEQVDNATEELELALEERLRAESIKVMEEFTDKLINGDFA